MKSFAASNAYVSAVHDLIPGGAHTYAKGDDQYPDGMAPVIERGAGCRDRRGVAQRPRLPPTDARRRP